ncbi:unnamed protein product [Choristocarpus tenellus]
MTKNYLKNFSILATTIFFNPNILELSQIKFSNTIMNLNLFKILNITSNTKKNPQVLETILKNQEYLNYKNNLNKTEISLIVNSNTKTKKNKLLLISPVDLLRNTRHAKLERVKYGLFSFREGKFDSKKRICNGLWDSTNYIHELNRPYTYSDTAASDFINSQYRRKVEGGLLYSFFSNTTNYYSKNKLGGYKSICPVFFTKEEAQNLLTTAADEMIHLNKKYHIYGTNNETIVYKPFPKYIIHKERITIKAFNELQKKKKNITFLTKVKNFLKINQYRLKLANYKTFNKQQFNHYLQDNTDDFMIPQIPAEKKRMEYNKEIFTSISNARILTMGLGDFLEFYLIREPNTLKKLEFLFIPSSKINNYKKYIPKKIQKILTKKSAFKTFDDYQKKFYQYNTNIKTLETRFTVILNFKNKTPYIKTSKKKIKNHHQKCIIQNYYVNGKKKLLTSQFNRIKMQTLPIKKCINLDKKTYKKSINLNTLKKVAEKQKIKTIILNP